jgi:hypothetical protein
MLGRGISTIYELMADGKIRGVKSDGRTLIVVKSLHEYVDALPSVKIKPREKRAPQHLRQRRAEKEREIANRITEACELTSKPPRPRPRVTMWDSLENQQKRKSISLSHDDSDR